MRASLLLAALPLAAALPRGSHAHVFDKLKRLVSTGTEKLYSGNIPARYYVKSPNSTDENTPTVKYFVKPMKTSDTIASAEDVPLEIAPLQQLTHEAIEAQQPKQEAIEAQQPKQKVTEAATSGSAQNSTSTSYQTEVLKLHNDARVEAGKTRGGSYKVVKLSWSKDLADLSRKWAEGCKDMHSNNQPKEPGTVAENIAQQPIGMAGTNMTALTHSWTIWYTEELPYFNFDFSLQAANEAATGKQTGHVKNILNPAFNKVGQASHLCTKDPKNGEPTEKHWYFTVSSFSGPVPAST